jgi:hypothetical protein
MLSQISHNCRPFVTVIPLIVGSSLVLYSVMFMSIGMDDHIADLALAEK